MRQERKILRANVEGRGAVPIEELIALPFARWEHLRLEINKRHKELPNSPFATCGMCDQSIYITSRSFQGAHYPIFTHRKSQPVECAWYDEDAHVTPDDPRAAQYKGNQESKLHKDLCELVASQLQKDSRKLELTVGQYLRPQIEKRGHYPDVYVKLEGLGKYAFEVQLAKPFPLEISRREIFYDNEGLSLVWLFYGIVPVSDDLPQGFKDVIISHRGNCFLIDKWSMLASERLSQLVLRCYRRNDDGSYDRPKLILVGQLTKPERGLPFYEDRLTPGLLRLGKDARNDWWPCFRNRKRDGLMNGYGEKPFLDAIADLGRRTSLERAWREYPAKSDYSYIAFMDFIASVFSIARSANDDSDVNYVTAHKLQLGKQRGLVLQILNLKLSGDYFAPYATLLEEAVFRSPFHHLLNRPSLRDAITQCQKTTPQHDMSSPQGKAIAALFPEYYDLVVRQELSDLGTLPKWAKAPT
jgi:hypothetical protein